jgi:prepilin-type N-terminal cleavage/methylation domain-containing protein
MRTARGFTLLEAVVALTLLGFVLLGAFTWVSNDLNALGKVRDLALEESAVHQAIAEIEQVDLSAQPTGMLDWRGFRIGWRAELLAPVRQGRSATGAPGLYDLALYVVELDIANGARVLGRQQVRMVQHVLARRPEDAQ